VPITDRFNRRDKVAVVTGASSLLGSYWMAQAAAAATRPGSVITSIGSVLGSTTAESQAADAARGSESTRWRPGSSRPR
jgi:hypothetical protein